MKKIVSTFILSLAFAASVFAGSTPDKAKISSNFDDLGKSFASALPQVSGMQNIYADAFIGKIFPTAIPHFGAGVNGAIIKADTSALVKIFDELDLSAGGVNDTMYLPSASGDIRLGGVILPFDVGFVFLKTPNINVSDISLGFSTFGVDVRYALLEDGIACPGLSVGLGYLYNGINFGYSKRDSEVNFDAGIHSIYTTVQVSKSILFVTPFAGARFMVSSHNVDWKWDLGSGIKDSGTSSSDGFDFGNLQTQLYLGCGLDFFVFQTTLTGMVDVAHADDSKAFSGTLSFRVRL
ncbi:hypothetical protein [Treponema sp.]|uniref:hypothetical protein n=1 Tax=Treponema sp. TaxID=166 RepID=UPI00298E51DB|nr:hypothetical protein [Treponema sp.]MCQ2240735.1 hypothetical protein [Treponema sp.]